MHKRRAMLREPVNVTMGVRLRHPDVSKGAMRDDEAR